MWNKKWKDRMRRRGNNIEKGVAEKKGWEKIGNYPVSVHPSPTPQPYARLMRLEDLAR